MLVPEPVAVPEIRTLEEPPESEVEDQEAAPQIKHQTHRFVRHQYAWFRPGDPRITWFDLLQMSLADIVRLLARILDEPFITQ